jgi:Ring finger domain
MKSMDEQVLNIIEGLIESRNIFLGRTMNLIPHTGRELAYSHYLRNELCLLELTSRVFQHGVRAETANHGVVIDIPIPSNFLDAVPVVATPAQINNAVETIQEGSGTCAICQDTISGQCARIRHCGHMYHRNCVVTWFALSVRCPVCRHDIRGQDSQASQTSVHTE